MIINLQRLFNSRITFASVMLVGLIIIALVALSFRSTLKHSYHLEGLAEFDRAYILLNERVGTYVFGLQGLGGIYLVTNFKPTRQQVRQYAEFREFYSNFSGVRGFGFIRSVPAKELKAYEKSRQAIYPSFKVQFIDAPEPGDFLVVESIEPYEPNEQAVGREMKSEKMRRESVLRAVMTGEASLTKSITLVQLLKNEVGFLYFLPLYKNGYTPLTAEDRMRDLVGLTFAPIAGSAIEKYLAKRVNSYLHFAVYEEYAANEYKKILGTASLSDAAEYQRPMVVGGQKWLVKANYVKPESRELIRVLPGFLFIFLAALFLGMCFFIRRLLMAHPTKI
jgi:CHASE1-domain containing sensor protein